MGIMRRTSIRPSKADMGFREVWLDGEDTTRVSCIAGLVCRFARRTSRTRHICPVESVNMVYAMNVLSLDQLVD